MSTTVRDAVIAFLRDTGMTTVFGNPGSTELPMFRNYPEDFRYVLGLQESIVLGMADGFAQATRNAAMVNLHSSAGVGHSLGNLFTAWKNQTPLVVTAGQQARSILPYEPFLFADRPTEFPRPFVKWAVEPARAEDVPAAIARAYYVAMQAPQGPTFVSVPVDDWDRECDPVTPRKVSREVHGEAGLLAEIAEALAVAERPAIVVGAGVGRDRAWDQVVALAERHEASVWAAPMAGRAGFPENHRLFGGFLDAFRERIVKSLAGHDLILVLGAPAFVYHAEGFGPHMPEGAKLFLIGDDPTYVAWAPEGLGVVSSLRPALDVLLEGPSPRQRSAPSLSPHPAPIVDPVPTTEWLLQRIAALRPAGSIIVEEAPSARGPMHDRLPIVAPDTFYTTASGGLGHGLPAAVGMALGRPGEKVIAIIGDGSAMYSIQALWSAAQLRLPISFIILNNARYEALLNFGRHFGLQQTVGTLLPDLDFVGLATAQGLSAVRVEEPADLDRALSESFVASGPTLVEVIVD